MTLELSLSSFFFYLTKMLRNPFFPIFRASEIGSIKAEEENYERLAAATVFSAPKILLERLYGNLISQNARWEREERQRNCILFLSQGKREKKEREREREREKERAIASQSLLWVVHMEGKKKKA